MEKSVIAEVSEAEENNTTQQQIGGFFARKNIKVEAEEVKDNPYAEADRRADKEKGFADDLVRDRNRDSMFGTMLLTSNISKEHSERMLQMQDPH